MSRKRSIVERIDVDAIDWDGVDKNYLGVREIARLFGETDQLISAWISRGKLPEPDIDLPRRRLWSVEKLRKFLEDELERQ